MLNRETYFSEWFALNRELASFGNQIVDYLTSPPHDANPKNIVLAAFTRKGTRTLEAIQLLANGEYWEEVKSLVRVLLELMPTVQCFDRMVQQDELAATQRVFDSLTISEFRLYRLSNYTIPHHSAEERKEWEMKIDEIKSRYGEAEFDRIERNGFSGINVEQRFKDSNLKTEYDVFYRELSRSIHCSDAGDQLDKVWKSAKITDHLARNTVLLSFSHSAATAVFIRSDIERRYFEAFTKQSPVFSRLMERNEE